MLVWKPPKTKLKPLPDGSFSSVNNVLATVSMDSSNPVVLKLWYAEESLN